MAQLVRNQVRLIVLDRDTIDRLTCGAELPADPRGTWDVDDVGSATDLCADVISARHVNLLPTDGLGVGATSLNDDVGAVGVTDVLQDLTADLSVPLLDGLFG